MSGEIVQSITVLLLGLIVAWLLWRVKNLEACWAVVGDGLPAEETG